MEHAETIERDERTPGTNAPAAASTASILNVIASAILPEMNASDSEGRCVYEALLGSL